jgi:hypothetical protein
MGLDSLEWITYYLCSECYIPVIPVIAMPEQCPSLSALLCPLPINSYSEKCAVTLSLSIVILNLVVSLHALYFMDYEYTSAPFIKISDFC